MRTMLQRTCAQCEETFEITLGDANRGRGIYCSSACQGLAHRGSGNPSYIHGHAPRERETVKYRLWRNLRQRGAYTGSFEEYLAGFIT